MHILLQRKFPIVLTGFILLLFLTLTGSYHLLSIGTVAEQPDFKVLCDSAAFTPGEAVKKMLRNGEKVDHGFFNAGFTKYKWWAEIKIHPTEKSWIQVANPHINKISIYKQDGADWKQVYQSGDYYPYEQRILDDPDYWYPVDTGSQTILMRVDKAGESLQIPVRLVKEEDLSIYLSNKNFFHGIFLGWIILLIMLNTFLWISLRDHIHLFYILYVSLSVCWILSQWGIGFKFFWPDSVTFNSKSRPVFSNISYVFLLELTARFFTIPHTQPLYTRAIRIIQALLLISSVGLLFVNIPESSAMLRYGFLTTMNVIWIATLVLIILFIWKSYRRQRLLAQFFLAALGFFATYVFLVLLSQYKINGDWTLFANMYGSPIGFLGESTILSFGLSQRYNFYKTERETAIKALEKERREVADKIIQTQEEERNRLARELHDGLGGLLGGIRISAHHRLRTDPETQAWIGEQLDLAVTDLRNIAHDLMPVQLQELGLETVLSKTIDRWNYSETLIIRYNSQVVNRYPLRTEAGLYRIVLELLHNIKKHAAATEVNIEIWEDEKLRKLTLLVEDNGTGFEQGKEEGFGWKSIRQRVQYMGGKLNLDTSHLGTTVIIEISMENEKE